MSEYGYDVASIYCGCCISDESVRQACGHVLLSMAQQSPDAFKRHAAVALPLAFLAMHEKKEKRKHRLLITSNTHQHNFEQIAKCPTYRCQ